MSVWLAIPSKRPPQEAEPVLKQWRERGYKIALHIDEDVSAYDDLAEKMTWCGRYPGYARAVNGLCNEILESDPDATWIIAAGDDTLPDPRHCAEEIAQECRDHFAWRLGWSQQTPATFGVMQPTGDPWSDSAGRIIERIAGSPWIGREFARRMYGGAGPYWHEYTHCFVDEELQNVAQKLGVFWQRPDLIHHHQNWARPKHPSFPAGNACDMPDFLREANSPEHWAKYKGIFKARKAAGFPGHEPIA